MSQPRSDTPHGQGLALADWLMACHEERAHPIYRDERFKQAAVEIRYAWGKIDALSNAIESHRRLAAAESDAMRHDLERSVANHVADLNDKSETKAIPRLTDGDECVRRGPEKAEETSVTPEFAAEAIAELETAKRAAMYGEQVERVSSTTDKPVHEQLKETVGYQAATALSASGTTIEGYPGIAHGFETMRRLLRGVSNLLHRCLRHGLLRAETEAMLRDIESSVFIATAPQPITRPAGESTVTPAMVEAVAPGLLEALIKLSNEAMGSAEMARECIGNTNANLLRQRAEEARAIIAKITGTHYPWLGLARSILEVGQVPQTAALKVIRDAKETICQRGHYDSSCNAWEFTKEDEVRLEMLDELDELFSHVAPHASAIEPLKCRTCQGALVQATVDKCDSGEACPFYRYRSVDRGAKP